jgi:ABC-type multidrug transport system fused ATPase/permease subunit
MKHYFSIIKRLWIIFSPFHKYIYIQVFLVFLLQLVNVLITVNFSKILNVIVENDKKAVLFFLVITFSLSMSYVIIDYFAAYIREKNLDQDVVQFMQEHSLRKILNLTVEQHIEDHSAIKLQIISRGESSAEQIISTIFINVLPTVLYISIAIGTLIIYSVPLGIFALFVMIVLFIWTYRFRAFHHPYILKNRDNWTEQMKRRSEVFTHLPMVKLFAQENHFIKRYILDRLKIVKHHQVTRNYAMNHRAKRQSLIETSDYFALGIACLLFLTGAFQVGALYLITSLSSRVYNQIGTLSGSLRDLPVWFIEVEKYLSAIDKIPSFDESGKKPNLDSNIVFSSVSFKYPKGDHNVVEKISLDIEAGKKTAFVGSSGSGKSTIVKLLLRAYTYTKGSIKIGDTELKDIDTNYLRHKIGYVEQHVDLLDDTIKENIIFGVEDSKRKNAEKKLEEVAKHARITEFYHRLGEKRFDTVVGERGIKLSGGERQRVGIARAIIKDPDILIFDEATSSLDTENEAKVMEAINDVSQGKTTIIIAHRLSTVRDADKIIVMDKGKIAGMGTHDELMQSNAVYQNLVAHQLS